MQCRVHRGSRCSFPSFPCSSEKTGVGSDYPLEGSLLVLLFTDHPSGVIGVSDPYGGAACLGVIVCDVRCVATQVDRTITRDHVGAIVPGEDI